MSLSIPGWSRRLLALLALFLFAMSFQGSRGLWDPDEGRYTNVALEMLHANDFMRPMLHPEHPHYTKPPLTYWTIGLSARLLGQNEWAVRFPYALAFIATVLLVYGLGRYYQPHRPWLPALIYATSLLPYAAANAVTTDTLLTLWETLAIVGFIRAYFGVKPGKNNWIALMWLGFGLAFLTKGPPGLLPLLAIMVFLAIRREGPWLGALFAPLGLLIFAVTGLSWFLLLVLSTPHLWDYFIQYEFLARVASASHHRHGEWYGGLEIYVPTLLLGSLPWTLRLLGRLPELRRVRNVRVWLWPCQLHPRWQFALAWFAVPMLVFLLVRSRLPLYVLPLFVPLSLGIAQMIPEDFARNRLRAGIWIGSVLVVLLSLRWYASVVPYEKDARALAREISLHTSRQYEGLVFVDQKPRYGLGLYLNTGIEHVCMQEDCAAIGLAQDERLEDELARAEYPQLYLVRKDAVDSFMKRMHAMNIKGRVLGEVRGMTLVERLRPDNLTQ